MTDYKININPGHIARHTPRGTGAQGREAAIIDIAQDLLLRKLCEDGALDNMAFKGGTALRKLYAGNEGRFSLDLDFSVSNINSIPEETLLSVVTAIDETTIGPFQYGVKERRGKWSITYQHDFGGTITLESKLDLSPPPWLSTVFREWIPMPIHKQYGDPILPGIQAVCLEENVAEKIARLNRTTPARDMYDLCWIARNPNSVGKLDKDLIRRLAVLKIWVDANGLHAGNTSWKPGHAGHPFDPSVWLRDRSQEDFDTEDMGALAVPIPTAKELADVVRFHYSFLFDLDNEERLLSSIRERDRPIALKMLLELPGRRLVDVGLY